MEGGGGESLLTTAKSSPLRIPWMMECIQLRCNLSYKLEADEKLKRFII